MKIVNVISSLIAAFGLSGIAVCIACAAVGFFENAFRLIMQK